MSRSVWKGPFFDGYLLKKAEKLLLKKVAKLLKKVAKPLKKVELAAKAELAAKSATMLPMMTRMVWLTAKTPTARRMRLARLEKTAPTVLMRTTTV